MSARTRRKKPSPAHPGGAPGAQASAAGPAAALPRWQWRTFPVYLAFSVGGFLGLYSGLLAPVGSAANVVVFAFWAVLLGFGFSRFTSRWMMSHNVGRRFAKKG